MCPDGVFILLGILWASWISSLLLTINLGKFLTILFKYVSWSSPTPPPIPPESSFYRYIPRVYFVLFHGPWVFCSMVDWPVFHWLLCVCLLEEFLLSSQILASAAFNCSIQSHLHLFTPVIIFYISTCQSGSILYFLSLCCSSSIWLCMFSTFPIQPLTFSNI